MFFTIRRVITGVSGSPRNLPALRYAAALAHAHGAALTTVLTWVPPGGEFADRSDPSASCGRNGSRPPASACTTR